MSNTPSPSEISNLLKTQTYNPQILPQLEAYLYSQIEPSTGNKLPNPYNFHANRTLVKLYQFFPNMAKVENLILVELLALVYGNESQEASVDFGALGCLISESFKKEEPFPALIRCAELLDSCQFAEFWSTYTATIVETTNLPKVSQLAKSNHSQIFLRRSILTNLSLTFQSTSLSNVLAQLNFTTGAELQKFVDGNTNGLVKNIAGDVVYFIEKPQNTKREKIYQEGGVDYATIRNLMLRSKGAAPVRE